MDLIIIIYIAHTDIITFYGLVVGILYGYGGSILKVRKIGVYIELLSLFQVTLIGILAILFAKCLCLGNGIQAREVTHFHVLFRQDNSTRKQSIWNRKS